MNPSAPTMSGLGDYVDIAILQPGTGTSTEVSPRKLYFGPSQTFSAGQSAHLKDLRQLLER